LERAAVNETADRLERVASTLREIEVSDRTAAIIELLAMSISQTLRTSPDDTAEFVALVARMMRP
jgi:hypothetical protein